MDQTKNQGQQNQGQGNQGQGQGNRTQGNNPGQGGQQQNWNQGPNPNRDQAEGSRETVKGDERGLGNQGEKNRDSEQRDRSSGVTNRGIDREMSEQQELPERGRSRSDSGSGSSR
jgi:hypothetical protein